MRNNPRRGAGRENENQRFNEKDDNEDALHKIYDKSKSRSRTSISKFSKKGLPRKSSQTRRKWEEKLCEEYYATQRNKNKLI